MEVQGKEGEEERQVVILFFPSPAEKWLPSALSALDISCKDLIKLQLPSLGLY